MIKKAWGYPVEESNNKINGFKIIIGSFEKDRVHSCDIRCQICHKANHKSNRHCVRCGMPIKL